MAKAAYYQKADVIDYKNTGEAIGYHDVVVREAWSVSRRRKSHQIQQGQWLSWELIPCPLMQPTLPWACLFTGMLPRGKPSRKIPVPFPAPEWP